MNYKFFSIMLVVSSWMLVAGSARADLPNIGAVTVETASSTPTEQILENGIPGTVFLDFSLNPTEAEDVWVDGLRVKFVRQTSAGETSALLSDVINLSLQTDTETWTASQLAEDGTVSFTITNKKISGGTHAVWRLRGTSVPNDITLRVRIPENEIRQYVMVRGAQSGQQLVVTGGAQGQTVRIKPLPAPKPDLIVTDFSWTPSTINISPTTARLRLKFSLKNNGLASAALPTGFLVNFYWKNMGQPLATWRLESQRVLASGEGFSQEDIVSFTDTNLGTVAGRFPVFADVDASNLVEESLENNNILQKTISIVGVLAVDTTPPGVSSLQISNVTTIDARVSWNTNEPTTGIVEFGSSTAFGFTRSDFSLSNVHYFALTQLLPDTKYFYRVRSRDLAGNETVSEVKEFKTTRIRDAEIVSKLTFSLSTLTPPPTVVQAGLIDVPFLKFMAAATGTDDIEVRSVRLRMYRDDPIPFLALNPSDIVAVRIFDGYKQIGKVTQFEQSMATFQFVNKEMVIVAGTNKTYDVVADLGVKPKARLLHIDLTAASIRQDVVSRGVKTGVDVNEDGGASGQFMAIGEANESLVVANPIVTEGERQAPVTADVDSDGLTEEQEILYHTDPRHADTDGDGYLDGAEIKNGYDPRSTCKMENLASDSAGPYGKKVLKSAAIACRAKYLRSVLFNAGAKKIPGEKTRSWQNLLNAFVYGYYPPSVIKDGLQKFNKVHAKIGFDEWKKTAEYQR